MRLCGIGLVISLGWGVNELNLKIHLRYVMIKVLQDKRKPIMCSPRVRVVQERL